MSLCYLWAHTSCGFFPASPNHKPRSYGFLSSARLYVACALFLFVQYCAWMLHSQAGFTKTIPSFETVTACSVQRCLCPGNHDTAGNCIPYGPQKLSQFSVSFIESSNFLLQRVVPSGNNKSSSLVSCWSFAGGSSEILEKRVISTSSCCLSKTYPISITLPSFPLPPSPCSPPAYIASFSFFESQQPPGIRYPIPPPPVRNRDHRTKGKKNYSHREVALYEDLLRTRDVTDICYNTVLSDYPDKEIASMDDLNIRIYDKSVLIKQLDYFIEWDDFRSCRKILKENPEVLSRQEAVDLLRSVFRRIKITVPMTIDEVTALYNRTELEWLQNTLELSGAVLTEKTFFNDSRNVADVFSYTPFTANPSVPAISEIYQPFWPYRQPSGQPDLSWPQPVGPDPAEYHRITPLDFDTFTYKQQVKSRDSSDFSGTEKRKEMVLRRKKLARSDDDEYHERFLGKEKLPAEGSRERLDMDRLIEHQKMARNSIDGRFLLIRRGLFWHGALQIDPRMRRNYWKRRNMPVCLNSILVVLWHM
eukprot:GHVQ01025165.1.p1 GENE.GHVQ01025165.1~~GHVQ01025165.1.p1  ORF type:complete len:533 (-),score=42.88 GHVQ01025165.1:81-1679(-)